MKVLLGIFFWSAAEAWAPARPAGVARRGSEAVAHVGVGHRAGGRLVRLGAAEGDEEDGAGGAVTSFADAADFTAGTTAVGDGELMIVKFWYRGAPQSFLPESQRTALAHVMALELWKLAGRFAVVKALAVGAVGAVLEGLPSPFFSSSYLYVNGHSVLNTPHSKYRPFCASWRPNSERGVSIKHTP